LPSKFDSAKLDTRHHQIGHCNDVLLGEPYDQHADEFARQVQSNPRDAFPEANFVTIRWQKLFDKPMSRKAKELRFSRRAKKFFAHFSCNLSRINAHRKLREPQSLLA
jgi:hypothetical protein